MPNTIAIIPARYGSKRLPNKNTMDLGGRPLLAYSTMVARAMGTVDAVCCTSDDTGILRTAWEWGADVLINRPPELSDDEASIAATLKHALVRAEEARGIQWDWVVLLQPNVPLRTVQFCDWAVNEAWKKGADAMLTVDDHAFKLGTTDEDGWFTPNYPVGARKQDMMDSPHLRENGVLYLFRANNVRKGQLFGIIGDKGISFVSPWESSLSNIDTPEEFAVTKALHQMYWSDGFNELQAELIMPRLVPAAAIVG